MLDGIQAQDYVWGMSADAWPFATRPALVGMIHVAALPGTPRSRRTVAQVAEAAVGEARMLAEAGFDGLLLENMHDVPYLCGAVGPEIVAAMTAVACAVRRAAGLPLGIQVLAGANREALAVALAAGAQFVRVENFVFAHVADEGLMSEAAAGPLLRFRRQIGADAIRIWADVKKKHASHALTADWSLAETARAAEWCGADGVIVTGATTGAAPAAADLAAAKGATSAAVLAGSGVTPDNLPALWPSADGFIVGSFLKRDGHWANPLDRGRIDSLLTAATRLRRTHG